MLYVGHGHNRADICQFACKFGSKLDDSVTNIRLRNLCYTCLANLTAKGQSFSTNKRVFGRAVQLIFSSFFPCSCKNTRLAHLFVQIHFKLRIIIKPPTKKQARLNNNDNNRGNANYVTLTHSSELVFN